MPKLNWALICEKVITDSETNVVSYINAVEQFGAAEFPFDFPRLFVTSTWRREEEGDVIKQRITVLNEDGEVLYQPKPVEQEFGEYQRYRLNRAVGGFEVPSPGDLFFRVECWRGDGWKETAEFPVTVTKVDPERDESLVRFQ